MTKLGVKIKGTCVFPECCWHRKERLISVNFVRSASGIKLTLSALLDGKNINAGGHKLGLGLEFQA